MAGPIVTLPFFSHSSSRAFVPEQISFRGWGFPLRGGSGEDFSHYDLEGTWLPIGPGLIFDFRLAG